MGIKSPCKKECQRRSAECRINCEEYQAYWAAKQEEYAKKAATVSGIPDSAGKMRMYKINVRNKLKGRT